MVQSNLKIINYVCVYIDLALERMGLLFLVIKLYLCFLPGPYV